MSWNIFLGGLKILIMRIQRYSKAIEELTGVADLIAFARDGDWAACFKLTDYSGNPRVYVHDLGNKDNKYECKDFDEWLAEEIKRAKEY